MTKQASNSSTDHGGAKRRGGGILWENFEGQVTTLSQTRFICRTQKTSRQDRFCLELARFCLGTGLCSVGEIQATRGTLSRPSFTSRRKIQSRIVGCGAAQKKERNVAQTESTVKRDRLCVACLSAKINRMSARRAYRGGGLRHRRMKEAVAP
jgi:hypothetical protein